MLIETKAQGNGMPQAERAACGISASGGAAET